MSSWRGRWRARRQVADPEDTVRPQRERRPPDTRVVDRIGRLCDADHVLVAVAGGLTFLGCSQLLFHAVWWTPSTLAIVAIALGAWLVSLTATVAVTAGLIRIRLRAAERHAGRAAEAASAPRHETAGASTDVTTLDAIAAEWGELFEDLSTLERGDDANATPADTNAAAGRP